MFGSEVPVFQQKQYIVTMPTFRQFLPVVVQLLVTRRLKSLTCRC